MDAIWHGGWATSAIYSRRVYVEYLIKKPPKGGFFMGLNFGFYQINFQIYSFVIMG